MDALAVTPESRGKGVGRTGLNVVANVAIRHGLAMVQGSSVRNPDTLKFYKRFGFNLNDCGEDYVAITGLAVHIAKITE